MDTNAFCLGPFWPEYLSQMCRFDSNMNRGHGPSLSKGGGGIMIVWHSIVYIVLNIEKGLLRSPIIVYLAILKSDKFRHSAHLGYFRRLPPASDIRLGRNG